MIMVVRVLLQFGWQWEWRQQLVATTAIASLCSLVSAAQEKERENDIQRRTNRDKEKKL
jgi:hypothetical protein